MLLDLSLARKVSLAALSALIGRNTTYLQQFVRKGSPRRLEERDRHTLARFFGIEESGLRDPEEISFASSDWIDIPRLALGASAGPGAFGDHERAFGSLRFSHQWLRALGLAADMLSAIAVDGDSMQPTLNDGDEILVDRTARPFREGVHVVRRDDHLLVKRVSLGQPGRIILASDNPAYPRQDLPRDTVTIIGRIVWKGGRI